MLRAPADSITVRPATRAAGRVRVPGDKSISHRYALFAALADGESHISGYSPGADCAATLGCLRGLGVAIRATGPSGWAITGRGLGGLRAPDSAARRGQFRDDDSAAGRDPRGTCVSDGDRRRRLAAAPADAPNHRAAHAHGRANRFDGRPCAADHRRRRPPGDRVRTGDAERPGQERRAAGGPACVRPHPGRRAGAYAGSYGTRARSVRRHRDSRRSGRRGRRGPAARIAHPVGAGRYLRRGILGRPGRRHARVRHRDRWRRTESVTHRRARRVRTRGRGRDVVGRRPQRGRTGRDPAAVVRRVQELRGGAAATSPA